MNNILNTVIVLLTVITISCKQQSLLVNYGTEDRLLIYSDSTYSEGNIIFKIKEYKFYFNETNFKNIMLENYDIEFEAFSYLKTFSQKYLNGEGIEFVDNNYGILINGIEAKFPLSYDIRFVLDKLVRKGEFFLENNGEYINFIEYKYWTPQYQGSIKSEWIVDNETVNEFTWGFVD